MGNLPLEVAPGQQNTHVNSYRHYTTHRGKVDPGVSELPQRNELSRDHVNRPLTRWFVLPFFAAFRYNIANNSKM